jgi:cell division protein FtsN
MANKRGQATRNPSNPMPPWVWLLAGFALGVGLSVVLIFRDWSKERAQASVPKPAPAASIADMARGEGDAAPDPALAAPDSEEPKYSFYEVLPDRKVQTPVPENQLPVDSSSQAAPANVRYFLQVGSYPDHAKADASKAQLALIGVQAKIVEVNVNGTIWHRVTTGPYASMEQQAQAKQLLMQNNIEAIGMQEPL